MFLLTLLLSFLCFHVSTSAMYTMSIHDPDKVPSASLFPAAVEMRYEALTLSFNVYNKDEKKASSHSIPLDSLQVQQLYEDCMLKEGSTKKILQFISNDKQKNVSSGTYRCTLSFDKNIKPVIEQYWHDLIGDKSLVMRFFSFCSASGKHLNKAYLVIKECSDEKIAVTIHCTYAKKPRVLQLTQKAIDQLNSCVFNIRGKCKKTGNTIYGSIADTDYYALLLSRKYCKIMEQYYEKNVKQKEETAVVVEQKEHGVSGTKEALEKVKNAALITENLFEIKAINCHLSLSELQGHYTLLSHNDVLTIALTDEDIATIRLLTKPFYIIIDQHRYHVNRFGGNFLTSSAPQTQEKQEKPQDVPSYNKGHLMVFASFAVVAFISVMLFLKTR